MISSYVHNAHIAWAGGSSLVGLPEQLHACCGGVSGQFVEHSCEEMDATVAKILEQVLHLALLYPLTEHQREEL